MSDLLRPRKFLYRGMGETEGQLLETLDEELQGICEAYYQFTGASASGCKLVLPLKERLVKQYGDQIAEKTSMAKMVGTNAAYSMAMTPVIKKQIKKEGGGEGEEEVVFPNPNHRVVLDDIGWGLCVLLSIAIQLNRARQEGMLGSNGGSQPKTKIPTDNLL